MAREKLCPKCGEDITDSRADDDPDCGITGGYFCDACDEGFPLEDDEDDYRED
jgi:hypothetical protein